MELIAASTILGLSEGAFITLVTSVIGLAGLISVAIINTRRSRRAAESATDTLGEKPDKDVTVMSLLQAIVTGQAGQDKRLAHHDEQLAEHHERLNEHHARIEAHAEMLRKLHGKDAA